MPGPAGSPEAQREEGLPKVTGGGVRLEILQACSFFKDGFQLVGFLKYHLVGLCLMG